MLGLLFIIGLLIFVLVVFIQYVIKQNKVKKAFEKNNVIVFGKKGKGKDLIFQYIIGLRNKEYFSNISYGGKYNNVSLKELELKPNTYHNFINENVAICEKGKFENKDIYISDGGVYLPSQHDSTIHKTYPSLPIFYALSRHLYNNNVHINVQNIERLFKGLREQADTYIQATGVIKIFNWLIVSYTYYDKYQAALNGLQPFVKARKEQEKALQKQYECTNGEIFNGFFIIHKKEIHYDTRAFHKKLFGIAAPTKKAVGSKKPTYISKP